MSNMAWVRFITFCIVFYGACHSALAYDCPRKIGVFANSNIFGELERVYRDVYSKLNCKTEFINYPSRRSIALFNGGKIDGEIFRLPVIEAAYKRPFVASREVFSMKMGLFTFAESEKEQLYDIGYVIGIKWHEQYLKDNFSKYSSMKRFTSVNEMLGALVRGKIKYALSEEKTVAWFFQKQGLMDKPYDIQMLKAEPVHHYVAAEYQDFMAAFNAYLDKYAPFKAMGVH